MNRTLVIAALAAALAGCATFPAPVDPATCRTEHPEWSARDCDRLAEGKVWIGMTVEQFLAVKGRPHQIDRLTTEHGSTEAWSYYRSSLDGPLDTYWFTNGRLTAALL